MEIETPLVSVIVPCYNYGRFLEEALQSVLKQTFLEWECLIVDNGSVDNTSEIAKQFSEKDKRFKYLLIENKGVSNARNTGIKNSKGKFILPLDADDKIGTAYLEKATSVFAAREEIKIVYCKAELFGELKGEWPLPIFNLKDMLCENMIFCSALFKRSDYNKTSGYNDEMKDGFEDWDFWLSLLSTGVEVYQIPEILFYYRIRTSSKNNHVVTNRQLQRSLRKIIYDRHTDLYKQYLSVPDILQDLMDLKNDFNNLKIKSNRSIKRKIFEYFFKASTK